MAGYTCSSCGDKFFNWTEGCQKCPWETDKEQETYTTNYQEKLNSFVPKEQDRADMIEMQSFIRDLAGRKLDEIYQESYKFFQSKGKSDKAKRAGAALAAARTISLLYMYHFEVTLVPTLSQLEEVEKEYVETK